jgi:ADP-heptose:LPS heptosyltransferase
LKILLVRPRLIGDVLLTTPVIRAMRRRYPDAELVYLVEAHAAPVVSPNPHLSETIVIRHRHGVRRLLEDLRLAMQLRARRFDVAVDMHGGSRSGWLTFATGARMRVGYDVSGRSWMYTHRVARPVGYLPRHSVFSMWDLAAVVDASFADPPTPARDRLEMPVTPAAAAAVSRRFEQLGVTAADEVVVMHAAAGNEFRRWPEAAFGAVAARWRRLIAGWCWWWGRIRTPPPSIALSKRRTPMTRRLPAECMPRRAGRSMNCGR